MINRFLNETGRPKDGGINCYLRETGAHLSKRLLRLFRDFERIAPRKLFDDHHQTGTAIDDRIACKRRCARDDLCDITDSENFSIAFNQRDIRQIFWRHDRQLVTDPKTLVRCVDETAGSDEATASVFQDSCIERLSGGLHHLIERHILCRHFSGLDLDLICLDSLAPYGNVGDTRDPQQASANLPVRRHGHVFERHRFRGQPNLHNSTGSRQRLHHDRWRRPCRQRVLDCRQFLLD